MEPADGEETVRDSTKVDQLPAPEVEAIGARNFGSWLVIVTHEQYIP